VWHGDATTDNAASATIPRVPCDPRRRSEECFFCILQSSDPGGKFNVAVKPLYAGLFCDDRQLLAKPDGGRTQIK
jgi:hypothetical protein